MPRPRRHPLTAAFGRTLPRPLAPAARRYLDRLDRCLAALSDLACGAPGAAHALRRSCADPRAARRILSRFEGRWDDGDENLVRGWLDRWVPPGAEPVRSAARGLSEAAEALARIDARPETLWFFLWEMESLLPDLADKGGAPC